MERRLEERVAFVKSKLLSSHTIKVKNGWICDCVKFFLEQTPAISDEELYQAAEDQFLLSDVNESSNPVIPASVQQNEQPFTLYGTFVVQLLFLIDIAESPYEQYRRLHNIRLDAADEFNETKTMKAKRKRIFKLKLTDGHKTVSAIEYSTITSLNTKLSPGIKLKIIGPLQVANSIMLLESKNLEIMGGDVDHLLITNAYENVLLRALDKPTTDTPIRDYEENTLIEDSNPTANNLQQRPVPPVQQVQTPNDYLVGIDFDDDDDFELEALRVVEQEEARIRLAKAEARPVIPAEPMVVDHPANNLAVDEFIEIPDEDLRPVVRSQRPSRVSSETILIDDDATPAISKPLTRVNSWLEGVTSESTRSLSALRPLNSDEPATKKVARVEPTQMLTISDDFYKFKSHTGHNMLTCDQYLTLKVAEKLKKSYVLPCDIRAVNTLKIRGKEWLLDCEMTDSFSNHSLSAKFISSIVDNLSERTHSEMKVMYREMKKRPIILQDIEKIINELQEKIQNLTGFMKIEMELEGNLQPQYLIVQLLDENASDTKTFAQKLREENLQVVN